MEEETKATQKATPEESPRRKPYQTPKLERLGTLNEMTAFNGMVSTLDDGHGVPVKTG